MCCVIWEINHAEVIQEHYLFEAYAALEVPVLTGRPAVYTESDADSPGGTEPHVGWRGGGGLFASSLGPPPPGICTRRGDSGRKLFGIQYVIPVFHLPSVIYSERGPS